MRLYLENNGMTYKDIAGRFGVSTDFVRRTVKAEVEAGNGIKPDRRKGRPDAELESIHADIIAQNDPHPRTTDWMEHIKPLNARKRELEENVRHKHAELEAAKQELRDFTATLEQLLKAD